MPEICSRRQERSNSRTKPGRRDPACFARVTITLPILRAIGEMRALKSHPGIAVACSALVFFGAGVMSQAAVAAIALSPKQDASRIAEIMQRLRDVQRFNAVSVAPNGKAVAWTVTEKTPAEKGGNGATVAAADKGAKAAKTGPAADGGKPGELLQIAAADGARVRTVRILRSAKSCQYSNLRWSPDSRTLAFLSNCNHGSGSDKQFDIYEVAATGIAARRITHLRGLVNRLAYIGAPPPGRDNWWIAKLYTQAPGGTPQVTLDPSSVDGALRGLQIAVPRWSPDGSRIAFIGGLMSDQGVTGGDVYLIPAD